MIWINHYYTDSKNVIKDSEKNGFILKQFSNIMLKRPIRIFIIISFVNSFWNPLNLVTLYKDSKWNSPLFYMNFTPFFSPLFWMNLTPFLDETHPFLNMNFTPFLHEFHPFLSQLLWLNITPFMKYIILSKIIVEDV